MLKKTTCKRSSTRSNGLSSTVPFSVRYITEFVRVNGRFRLETVLVSNRAVPSLLTCKRAFRGLLGVTCEKWFRGIDEVKMVELDGLNFIKTIA